MGNPLTVALTATATPDVQEDIIQKLALSPPDVKIFHQGIERPNLRLEARDVINEGEKVEEITAALARYPGSAIIYFSLIKSLDRYSELLSVRGVEHQIYHGKLDAGDRKRVQRWFLEGENRLVLATNAFGMGIDKPDIRLVDTCRSAGIA